MCRSEAVPCWIKTTGRNSWTIFWTTRSAGMSSETGSILSCGWVEARSRCVSCKGDGARERGVDVFSFCISHRPSSNFSLCKAQRGDRRKKLVKRKGLVFVCLLFSVSLSPCLSFGNVEKSLRDRYAFAKGRIDMVSKLLRWPGSCNI